MGSFREIHGFPPVPQTKGRMLGAQLSSSCSASLVCSETPSNTASTFAFSKYPHRMQILGRKSHLLTAGQQLLTASTQKSLLLNLSLVFLHTHLWAPQLHKDRHTKLPWSWRGPNFRSDLPALLLTQCDKGAVSRQLPRTTTLAWIKREKWWTPGPTGTATREEKEDLKKNKKIEGESVAGWSLSASTSIVCGFSVSLFSLGLINWHVKSWIMVSKLWKIDQQHTWNLEQGVCSTSLEMMCQRGQEEESNTHTHTQNLNKTGKEKRVQ